MNQNNNDKKHACGFIFAFFNYSKMHTSGLFERMVHFALGSNMIHVAVIPAPCVLMETDEVQHAIVSQSVFTAFMGYGYEKESIESVLLRPEYEYVFLPVAPEAFVKGLDFLMSLIGKGYNYVDLIPLALLPHAWKIMAKVSASEEFGETNSRVFCSQAALMLCYVCEVFSTTNNEDPAYCSPGELYDLLLKGPNKKAIMMHENMHSLQIIEAAA